MTYTCAMRTADMGFSMWARVWRLPVAAAFMSALMLVLVAGCAPTSDSDEARDGDMGTGGQGALQVDEPESTVEIALFERPAPAAATDTPLAPGPSAPPATDESLVATLPPAASPSPLPSQTPLGPLAPELDGLAWLNSEPQTMSGLRGKVVMIDFWTFG